MRQRRGRLGIKAGPVQFCMYTRVDAPGDPPRKARAVKRRLKGGDCPVCAGDPPVGGRWRGRGREKQDADPAGLRNARQRHSLPEHEKPPPISANSGIPANARQIFRTRCCTSPPASHTGPAIRLRRKGADSRKIARLPACHRTAARMTLTLHSAYGGCAAVPHCACRGAGRLPGRCR